MSFIDSLLLTAAARELATLSRGLEARVAPIASNAKGVGAAADDPVLAAALNRFAAALSSITDEIGRQAQAASTMAANVSDDIIAATGGPAPTQRPGGLPLIIGASP